MPVWIRSLAGMVDFLSQTVALVRLGALLGLLKDPRGASKQLEEEVQRLRQQLDQTQRDAHRQAHPFRRPEGTDKRKKPGRCKGQIRLRQFSHGGL